MPVPIEVDGDRREVDFETVGATLDLALDAVGSAIPHGARVERIGIATTASTVAVVEPTGRPLTRGVLWADHRATREADAIRAVGHPNLRRMLDHVSPEWGIAKMLFLDRVGALAGRPDAKVVELVDWLGHRLTGRWLASAGVREWGWAGGDDGRVPHDLLASVGGKASLAGRAIEPAAVSGSVHGQTSPSVARRHPWLAEAVILVGGMDSHLAALGMGVAENGRLAISVGSSSAILAGVGAGDASGHLNGPLRRILPGDPGGYWQGGQTTAGLAADWAAGILDRSRAALERRAATVLAGSGGVTFRETLLDRRTPSPRAPMRGRWTGLGLEHGPGHLYRSVLEGVALGIAEAVEPLRPASVVATGGMLRSGLFAQILADVLGSPVGLLRSGETATLGAAFADAPGRISRLNPITRSIDPSGTDYSAVRARHRALGTEPA